MSRRRSGSFHPMSGDGQTSKMHEPFGGDLAGHDDGSGSATIGNIEHLGDDGSGPGGGSGGSPADFALRAGS